MHVIYCPQCGQQTELISIGQACQLMNKRRSTIYNWIHARKIHLYQDPNGRALICKSSLVRPFEQRQKRFA